MILVAIYLIKGVHLKDFYVFIDLIYKLIKKKKR